MQCAGDFKKVGQSPIDIDETKVTSVAYPPLLMSGHWNSDATANLCNTGTTVEITLEDGPPATVQGGPFVDDIYQLSEIVFKWGESDCKGAEHTLNGTWFTMEAQAVHFNRRYGTIDKCYDKRDGIAICAYFLQVYQLPPWDEHPLFSKITDNLHKITQYRSFTRISASSLAWMRQACNTPGYFTYSGSRTVPPYQECVTWIVFPEPIRISAHQANLFRMLRNKDGLFIRQNYREVQKLNGRVVQYVT